ncbi:MAG TPA: phosphotransferase [Propionibacteriaceae bacterium]|nr:phosphotransferase [Propionibacteriaceae bacterium]
MPRVQWPDLPPEVRRAIAGIAGEPVVSAVSQPGGFSPGSADRLLLADGRRVFAKAVSSAQDPESPHIHRREVARASALPPDAPAPRLLGSYDDGDWVALVLEDVEGRHPAEPWTAADLLACLGALDRLAETCSPNPMTDAERADDVLREMFAGFERVAADPSGVAPAVVDRLADLRDLASSSADAVAGQTLVHLDIRADNLLIEPTGRVVVIDWPWACTGADWLDTLSLLVNAEFLGCVDADVDTLVATSPRLAGVPGDTVDTVLAGFCAFFLDAARLPSPPGLPTLRAFQLAQGEATLRWLGRRRGW